tara:strand:- start:544 stop:933 length:390 start_codon:yes stop_codon:yes gene_type:complete
MIDNSQTITEKVPPILLEIFVHAKEEDKEKMKATLDKLQSQMKRKPYSNRTRIMWYADSKNQPFSEIKEWFLRNCNCKYYVFCDEATDDFVKKNLGLIKDFENSLTELKKSGIGFSTPKKEEKPTLKAV